jgi:hypothetical protein
LFLVFSVCSLPCSLCWLLLLLLLAAAAAAARRTKTTGRAAEEPPTKGQGKARTQAGMQRCRKGMGGSDDLSLRCHTGVHSGAS